MVQNDAKLSTTVVTTQNYQSAETTLTICPTHHTYPGSDQRRYVFPNAFEGHDSDHTDDGLRRIRLNLKYYESTKTRGAKTLRQLFTQLLNTQLIIHHFEQLRRTEY